MSQWSCYATKSLPRLLCSWTTRTVYTNIACDVFSSPVKMHMKLYRRSHILKTPNLLPSPRENEDRAARKLRPRTCRIKSPMWVDKYLWSGGASSFRRSTNLIVSLGKWGKTNSPNIPTRYTLIVTFASVYKTLRAAKYTAPQKSVTQ